MIIASKREYVFSLGKYVITQRCTNLNELDFNALVLKNLDWQEIPGDCNFKLNLHYLLTIIKNTPISQMIISYEEIHNNISPVSQSLTSPSRFCPDINFKKMQQRGLYFKFILFLLESNLPIYRLALSPKFALDFIKNIFIDFVKLSLAQDHSIITLGKGYEFDIVIPKVFQKDNQGVKLNFVVQANFKEQEIIFSSDIENSLSSLDSVATFKIGKSIPAANHIAKVLRTLKGNWNYWQQQKFNILHHLSNVLSKQSINLKILFNEMESNSPSPFLLPPSLLSASLFSSSYSSAQFTATPTLFFPKSQLNLKFKNFIASNLEHEMINSKTSGICRNLLLSLIKSGLGEEGALKIFKEFYLFEKGIEPTEKKQNRLYRLHLQMVQEMRISNLEKIRKRRLDKNSKHSLDNVHYYHIMHNIVSTVLLDLGFANFNMEQVFIPKNKETLFFQKLIKIHESMKLPPKNLKTLRDCWDKVLVESALNDKNSKNDSFQSANSQTKSSQIDSSHQMIGWKVNFKDLPASYFLHVFRVILAETFLEEIPQNIISSNKLKLYLEVFFKLRILLSKLQTTLNLKNEVPKRG